MLVYMLHGIICYVYMPYATRSQQCLLIMSYIYHICIINDTNIISNSGTIICDQVQKHLRTSVIHLSLRLCPDFLSRFNAGEEDGYRPSVTGPQTLYSTVHSGDDQLSTTNATEAVAMIPMKTIRE